MRWEPLYYLSFILQLILNPKTHVRDSKMELRTKITGELIARCSDVRSATLESTPRRRRLPLSANCASTRTSIILYGVGWTSKVLPVIHGIMYDKLTTSIAAAFRVASSVVLSVMPVLSRHASLTRSQSIKDVSREHSPVGLLLMRSSLGL